MAEIVTFGGEVARRFAFLLKMPRQLGEIRSLSFGHSVDGAWKRDDIQSRPPHLQQGTAQYPPANDNGNPALGWSSPPTVLASNVPEITLPSSCSTEFCPQGRPSISKAGFLQRCPKQSQIKKLVSLVCLFARRLVHERRSAVFPSHIGGSSPIFMGGYLCTSLCGLPSTQNIGVKGLHVQVSPASVAGLRVLRGTRAKAEIDTFLLGCVWGA